MPKPLLAVGGRTTTDGIIQDSTKSSGPAWLLRVFLVASTACLALGALLVALRSPWIRISFDRKGLCDTSPTVCKVDLSFALAWHCIKNHHQNVCSDVQGLESPGVPLLDETGGAPISPRRAVQGLIALASLFHFPLLVLLGIATIARGKSENVLRCGLRAAACFAVLSTALAVVAFVLFFKEALPNCTEYSLHEVGREFGALMQRLAKLKSEILVGPVMVIAASTFDVVVVMLTWKVEVTAQVQRLRRSDDSQAVTLEDLLRADPEYQLVPMMDGGDGTDGKVNRPPGSRKDRSIGRHLNTSLM